MTRTMRTNVRQTSEQKKENENSKEGEERAAREEKVKEEEDERRAREERAAFRFVDCCDFSSIIVNSHDRRIRLFTMIQPAMIPASPRRSDNWRGYRAHFSTNLRNSPTRVHSRVRS